MRISKSMEVLQIDIYIEKLSGSQLSLFCFSRNEKARILNFTDFAHLSLDTKMAESPEAVIDMLTNLKVKSKPDAEREVKQLKVSNFFVNG